MAPYRTLHRAVVHPVKSAKAFTPYCDLAYRNKQELKDTLVQYMRQFCGAQRVEVDTSTRGILVDGQHRYNYELIAPAPVKKTTLEMF